MQVSVIIPTYNRAGTIAGAVESVLRQRFTDMEVIVVDDGSTDETAEVLKPYDGVIRCLRQENAGPSAARNTGAAAARGEILAFLDSDDHWLPDKLARQVALMGRGGEGMSCCVCNAVVKGMNGERVGETFDFAGIRPPFVEGVWTNVQEVLATRFLLFNQVVAIRRGAFERVGGFRPDLRLLEDYELSLRLSSVGEWGVIRDPLVVKYNDTNGIGVECMTDREKHARTGSRVIGGLLSSEGIGLRANARSALTTTLGDLDLELRAIEWSGRGPIGRLCAASASLWLRSKRAVRRRSPRWPQFEGHALPD